MEELYFDEVYYEQEVDPYFEDKEEPDYFEDEDDYYQNLENEWWESIYLLGGWYI